MNRQLTYLTLAFALLLAGCYQKAGVAFQASDGEASATASGISSVESTATVDSSGGIAITVISPTLETVTQPSAEPVQPTQEIFITPPPTAAIATQVISSGSDQPPLTLIIPTAIPTRDPNAVVTVAPTTAPVSSGNATATTAFVTPNVPVAPPTLNTPVPTAGAPTAVLSSGGGLITPTAFSLDNTGNACSYTVQPGDTLYRITIRQNVDLEALRKANPQIIGDLLHPGDVLTLPACTDAQASPTPTPSVNQPPTATGTPLADGSQVYVVQPGDTIYGISLRFGVTMQAIINANSLANPDRLKLGQELIIPSSGG